MAQIHDIRNGLAVQSMAGFVYATMPGYLMGWVHETICAELDDFLRAVVDGLSPRLMLCMPPRHGKLCADDTPVLTSEGWKVHGDLRVGDFVFHPSGKPVRVLAVGEKACATHKVKLTNGDEIAVHLDHEWRVYSRPHKSYKTVETRFFVEPSAKTGAVTKLESGPKGKRGHRYLYQIDPANALQFAERKHVLPPYVLGVWLGDGTSCAPRINMAPEDARIVKKAFEKAGVPITKEWVHLQTGVVTFSFGSGIPNVRNVFSRELKRLSLLNDKHIPDEYLFSGIDSRLDLLAGLMDTDGSYDAKTNRYRFVTASKRLAEDVAELVRLCGASCHVNVEKFDERERVIKATQVVYCVSFFPEFAVPCRLKRKNNGEGRSRRAPRRISIASVEPLDKPKQGNCIQVDSPDGLYLVGRHLTPTHNSELASRRFPAYVFGRYPDMSIIGTSYSADLASRLNRDVQRVIEQPEYIEIFPQTTLSAKNIRAVATGNYLRNSDLFEIVGHRGSYRSAGVGGGITGMGAECVDGDAMVLTPQGAVKAKEIVAGMTVMGYNLQTKTVQPCTVDAVRRKYATEIYRLHSNRGRSLDVTGNHPVFSRGRFIEAHLLAEGSPLLCGVWPRVYRDGLAECRARVRGLPQGDSQAGILWRVRDEVLASNQKIPCSDGRLVIDLQVSDCHNFFANGILVHNCLIIDDPFKDRAEADSPTIRRKVWEWYTSTLYTRLAPGGGILIINTRWHMDDLSGRLLEAARTGDGDQWRVVNFPAIAEGDEPHRKRGEALHPERYPLEQLEAIRKAIGTRDWEALYQQHPVPDGGNIFKVEWLRFWLPKDLPETFDQMVISWDMTFKDGDDTDYVVGQVWARKGADRYLLDQVRARMGFTDTLAAFRALAEKWPQATRKLVEDKANGPAVIDSLKHHVSGIIPVEPDGSKTARAHAVTALFEAGNIHIPHPQHCGWASEYVAELTQFPGAAHDDQVDATTQALRDMERRRSLNINPAILNRPVTPQLSRFGGML